MPDDSTPGPTRPVCETEGCGRAVVARGMCQRCYKRARKRGLPLLGVTNIARPTCVARPTCEMEGCSRDARARGFCQRCYMRARKRGLLPLDVHRAASVRAALARPATRAKRASTNANPDFTARRAAAAREMHACPKFKISHAAATREALALPGVKARQSAATREALADPEVKARHAAALRASHAKPEVKAHRAAARARMITRDTRIERILHAALADAGIPFEKQKAVCGAVPDLFVEPNICIFADGDYWHRLPGRKERDAAITAALQADGYTVLRFWEKDIHEAVARCLATVRLAAMFRRAG